MSNKPKAVVVLSGGQDSSTCLAWAVRHFNVPCAVFFDYGQMHLEAEQKAAQYFAGLFNVPIRIVKTGSMLAMAKSSLVDLEDQDHHQPHSRDQQLPASFTPCRNLMFLTAAAAAAYEHGADRVITGVCETDYSGYPDCREKTMLALEEAIKLGLGVSRFLIVTPLMHLNKAQTFKMAADLGCLEEILEHSHTGYTGSRAHRYEWGWGPPEGSTLDPASQLRANGWSEYRAGRL